MENLVKISTEMITENQFKNKMEKVPDFFNIKMYESSLVYYGLAVYLKKEDLEKLGFQKVIDITNEYQGIFIQNKYV